MNSQIKIQDYAEIENLKLLKSQKSELRIERYVRIED